MAKLSHIDDFEEKGERGGARGEAGVRPRGTAPGEAAGQAAARKAAAENAGERGGKAAKAQVAPTRRRASNMAKLSHIDDFEEKDERGGARGGADVRPRKTAPEEAAGQAAARAAGKAAAENAGERGGKGAPALNTASDERDYHGLDEHGMGGGQKFIAIVSFAVLVAVVLYILNYWFHFV